MDGYPSRRWEPHGYSTLPIVTQAQADPEGCLPPEVTLLVETQDHPWGTLRVLG